MLLTSLNVCRGVSRILVSYLLCNELVLKKKIVHIVLEHIEEQSQLVLVQIDPSSFKI